MKRQTVISQRKKPGPPATGKGTPVLVRLQPNDLAALDAYRAAVKLMTRPQAIRAALSDWLRTHGYVPSRTKPTGPASDAVDAMDAAIKRHQTAKKTPAKGSR